MGWGWRWLCRGVHRCLHWQGQGCCASEGIISSSRSFVCFKMRMLFHLFGYHVLQDTKYIYLGGLYMCGA
jgi:hypothetical protein